MTEAIAAAINTVARYYDLGIPPDQLTADYIEEAPAIAKTHLIAFVPGLPYLSCCWKPRGSRTGRAGRISAVATRGCYAPVMLLGAPELGRGYAKTLPEDVGHVGLA